MCSIIHFLRKADDIDWGSVRPFLAPQRLHFITSYTITWHFKLTIHTDLSEPNALDIQNGSFEVYSIIRRIYALNEHKVFKILYFLYIAVTMSMYLHEIK